MKWDKSRDEGRVSKDEEKWMLKRRNEMVKMLILPEIFVKFGLIDESEWIENLLEENRFYGEVRENVVNIRGVRVFPGWF